MSSALIKKKLDVGFVENSFFSKISLANRLPHFFAFACATQQRLGFCYKFLAFVLWNVREGTKCFRHTAHTAVQTCKVALGIGPLTASGIKVSLLHFLVFNKFSTRFVGVLGFWGFGVLMQVRS